MIPARQQGFVLIASLLMLVVLTLLAVSMARSFGLQERMAGNLREKARAFDAAQSTLSYAEWWLTRGANATQVTTCSSPSTDSRVCSNALSAPATLPWAAGVSYTPPGMQLSSNGGLDTYFATPSFYIEDLGAASGGRGQLYRLTAAGYGGNASAVAVVQSTYLLSTGVRNLGNP